MIFDKNYFEEINNNEPELFDGRRELNKQEEMKLLIDGAEIFKKVFKKTVSITKSDIKNFSEKDIILVAGKKLNKEEFWLYLEDEKMLEPSFKMYAEEEAATWLRQNNLLADKTCPPSCIYVFNFAKLVALHWNKCNTLYELYKKQQKIVWFIRDSVDSSYDDESNFDYVTDEKGKMYSKVKAVGSLLNKLYNVLYNLYGFVQRQNDSGQHSENYYYVWGSYLKW